LQKSDNGFLNLFFPLDKLKSLPSWVNLLTSVPDAVKQLIPLILLKSKKVEKVKDEWFSRWAAD